jgi:hypothetical protein
MGQSGREGALALLAMGKSTYSAWDWVLMQGVGPQAGQRGTDGNQQGRSRVE